MALVDIVDPLTPHWTKVRPWWWNVFRLGAVLVDSLIEGIYQGRRAGMPDAIDLPGVPGYGGFEDVGSLDYIGNDRGVLRGLTEAPPAYAYRLRQSQNPAAGGWPAPTLFGLLEQLAGILGPTPPMMRVVNAAGDWWTRHPSGVYELARVSGLGVTYNLNGTTSSATPSFAAQAWNWDSSTVPPPVDVGFAGRWWLILYLPINAPFGTTFAPDTFSSGAVFGHQWSSDTTTGQEPDPLAATFGTNAPSVLVSKVFDVIGQRQCAGLQCSHVIVASDPTSFAPDGSSSAPAYGSAYPDGTWGWATRYDSASHARIMARNPTAEYWRFPSDVDITANVFPVIPGA